MRVARSLAAGIGIAVVANAGAAYATPPVGYLDVAACDVIAGWSQDQDEPAVGIAVHVYLGGPAGSGAPAVGVAANLYREDLCSAIGSCEHGFLMAPPLSLLDGQPHAVHAYGIDSQGGPNPELGNSPRPLQCAPTASGVRRRVAEVSAVDAWLFDSYWDVLPLPEGDAGALAEGVDWPDAPELVTPDDGSGALWLVDQGVRRAVPAAAIGPWRLNPAQAIVTPAAEIQTMVEGPSLRPRPVLVLFDGLVLIDDPLPVVPDGVGGGGAGGGGGGAGGDGGGGASGGVGGGGESVGEDDASAQSAACAIGGPVGAEDVGESVLRLLLAASALAALRRRR